VINTTTQNKQDELFIDSLNLDFGTILEKIILGGIIFILALPLIGDYGLTLFPVGRDIIFKLTVEFLIILSLLFWTLKNWTLIENWKLKIENLKAEARSPLIMSLVIFWIIMLAATATSVQQSFSIWGNIYKNQGFMTWSHYVLFFFILITFLSDKKYWKFLINTVILVGMVVGLISLWQMLKNGFTSMPSATLNNSNYLAAYLVLLIPVTLAFFLRKKSYFLGAALTLQAIALLATQTRGAYLGLVIALFVFSFLYLKYIKNCKKSKLLTVFIVTPMLLAAFYILLALTPARQYIQEKFPSSVRFLDIKSIYNTGGPRLEAWQAGWHAMLNKPILGYGPENFFVAFDEFYSGSQDHNGSLAIEGSLWESWFDKAHNFIFDIGVTTGFLGLFAYMAIFASAIWLLFRRLSVVPPSQKASEGHSSGQWLVIYTGLIASFVGYLVQNLFGFDTTVPGIYLVFFLAFANFTTTRSRKQVMREKQSPKIFNFQFSIFIKITTAGQPLVFISLLVLFALSIFSLKLHINILNANHQLNFAEVLSRAGQIDQSFAAYEKGLKYNASPINPNLRRRYGVIALAYYDAVKSQCADKFDQKKCEEFSKDSKKYLARALELQKENAVGEWPRFTRNYIYAAQISHILGYYKESDIFFEKALELSPNRKSINIEWERLQKEREGVK